MKTEFKKLPKSEVEIEFELTPEEFQKHVDHALLHFKEHVKMDGFRPGQAPLKMVQEKVGNEKLLMEAGDLAVNESYKNFIKGNNLEPVSPPEVQITKIAQNNPFLFKIKVAVLPQIELPDYKEIASHIKGKEIKVDQEEIEHAINYLQKTRAKFSQKEKPAEKNDFIEIEYQNKDINGGKMVKDGFILGEGGFIKDFEENVIGMKQGEEKEFKAKFPDNIPNKDLAGKEGDFKVKMVSVQKMELPEINDEFAKQLGQNARADREAGAPVSAFDTLVALKENIKEGITVEKTESEKQRKRGEILQKISEKITFDIPEKMAEYEQQSLLEDMKAKVTSQFKITFEEYLASVKKTEEEIKKSFALEAQKRIKNFLVLKEIGKKENIEVSDQEIEEDVQKLVKNYSKEQMDKIDIGRLKEYSKGAIYDEKVFDKLETFLK